MKQLKVDILAADMKDSFAVLLAPGANRPLAQEKQSGALASLVHLKEHCSSYRFRRPLAKGRTALP